MSCFRKKRGKFIYTYTVGETPKAFRADSLEGCVAHIINNYFSSFCTSKVLFINSDDPEAPKEKMLVTAKGLYSPVIMQPLTKGGSDGK